MPTVKTIRVKRGTLDFSYRVNVSKEGEFTTTLPPDIVNLLKKANIDLKENRLGNKGYFYSETLQGIKDNINLIIEEYFSREIIDSRIIIKYIIQTTCSYCHNTEGNIVPNGSKEWTKSDNYCWVEGTISQHANQPKPYGLQVFARAMRKETFKYKSGAIKVEYVRMDDIEEKEHGINCYHLNSFCSIAEPRGEDCKEIEYTEDVAKFFVDLLTMICKINDSIKNKLEPEILTQLINNGQRLLPM